AEDAAVAAGRVGEPDHGAGVQVAVRRLVLLAELESGVRAAVARLEDLDAEEAREARGARLLQLRGRGRHRPGPTLAPPWPGRTEKSGSSTTAARGTTTTSRTASRRASCSRARR